MDFTLARKNMVRHQLRPWGVYDLPLLNYMSELPREHFVQSGYQNVAYADTFLPMGFGETALPPKLAARMVQALQLKSTDKVLEVGTGTGYITAILGHLAKSVIGVERSPDLAKSARQLLSHLDIRNVTIETGDGLFGWTSASPYDAILLTGSIPCLPKIFREQLSVNGRLVAVLGDGQVMSVMLLSRVAKEYWSEQQLFETRIPPLFCRRGE